MIKLYKIIVSNGFVSAFVKLDETHLTTINIDDATLFTLEGVTSNIGDIIKKIESIYEYETNLGESPIIMTSKNHSMFSRKPTLSYRLIEDPTELTDIVFNSISKNNTTIQENDVEKKFVIKVTYDDDRHGYIKDNHERLLTKKREDASEYTQGELDKFYKMMRDAIYNIYGGRIEYTQLDTSIPIDERLEYYLESNDGKDVEFRSFNSEHNKALSEKINSKTKSLVTDIYIPEDTNSIAIQMRLSIESYHNFLEVMYRCKDNDIIVKMYPIATKMYVVFHINKVEFESSIDSLIEILNSRADI
jgi:hypothetical protein